MCERCQKQQALKTDYSPVETLAMAERLAIECSIRIARTALSQGEDPEQLGKALVACMPPAAAEFVFFAALATPDGPRLKVNGPPLRALASANSASAHH